MVIEINGVNKKIGSKQVIQDVSLNIGRGQVFALLGPNGAGKTTLIRIILGLLKAETGTIKLFGQELTAQSRSDLLLRIGVQNDGNLYENLTLEDNLALWGQIYGLDQATIQKRLAELKQKFHLEAYSNMPVGSLSKGNRQKVMLARAMFHNPEVLILDEPTTGLDPAAIDEFYDAIKALKQEGVTIIMSTHYLYGMDGVVDSIGIISEGRILISDAVDKLRRQDKQVHFKGKFKPDHIKELLAQGQVSGNLQDEFTISVENEDQLADLVRSLVQKGNDIHYVYKLTESVKDIYFRIIGVDSHE
ncbi:ABC transporter ATP-binding protein [Abiotrophia defectiva]|uniref:ABC transporter ATP-binding protein n=1 Tax=Abiotrophia defectiva TaxID=46125 RepID=UPI00228295D2|nr:ABC transporter ATP-binding protein [Abiotrophia defectiva]MCY7225339.1 ABC transporter ATP-binding protein [Abiotrophia defectiva]